MIEINIDLFTTLTRYYPKGSGSLKVEKGTTAGGLIHKLGIPDGSVSLIFINGKRALPDQALVGNDKVGLFPLVAGG
ncbi:MoaD/ThiS family protein [Desulfobacter hydrogenophilus]|uniref:MoaD/ThiS family protein n=1 Tax=Desulfobacter hydrogenophilus TaxID=2291 RepID=A0A328FCM3_9BACT|nr:MoaD/ThiS family protein [Desulfobacter hydrogenophilus]NDY72936.1 MoaD/ThiS family protein [Desulfobacter hydrogenophilus]QBH12438.1 MoaD/ThiS family protein [Desulfobacter hydrogenophilus]RAM01470.1 MoaD/ThiS family protein [Desulfobacter hydrogenophilus]